MQTTEEPEVLPPSTDVELMTRADLPVIWESYRQQLEQIKQTALTLNVTSVEQKLEMKLARETRLAIRQLRIEVEKRRKELGEDLLRQTQRINGAAKELKDAMEELEERLKQQEEFAERAEAARITALTEERTQKLQEVGAMIPVSVATITQEQFERLISDAILLKQAREEQARKAEEERIAKEKAEQEERERVRAENERLKAEAAAKEQQRQAELAAAEAERAKERAAAEAKLKAERERAAAERAEAEAKEKAEREKERAAAAEKLAAERKERDAAEAKAAKEHAEAESLRRAEQERLDRIAKEEAAARKAAEAAAKAPDKKKLAAFAVEVRNMTLPTLSNAPTSMKLAETKERFAAFVEDLAAKL